MKRSTKSLSILLLFLALSNFSGYDISWAADSSSWQMVVKKVDNVIAMSELMTPFHLASVAAPATPAVLIRKVICNYPVPTNDYVSYQIPYGGITVPFAQSSNNYNSVMITFEVAPTAPVMVWLQQASGSGLATVPVYVNNISVVVPYTSANALWFYNENTGSDVTYQYLCVQAIYPTPPPDSFYYPVSCMIVYQ